MSIEMRKGDPLNQTTCSTRSKESACPGCCACMNLFIFACCFIVVFALDATLFNGELMYQLRRLFLSAGTANCGWSMSFKDKSDVCVEIPPKIVDERRRYLLRGDRSLEEDTDTSIHMSTADEQSMKFYCNDSPEYAATNADCLKYCSAEYIYIKQVFLVEDEDDDRQSWKGRHLQIVFNEKVQNYKMDFALGCESEEYYLTQTFVPGSFQCGYSEIGYDLYHKVPTSYYDGLETLLINFERYYYARMSNLIFGPDLQNAIKKVKDGTNLPGIYTHAYPKNYDEIVSGCTFEYKVDFVIPKKYAPVIEGNITNSTEGEVISGNITDSTEGEVISGNITYPSDGQSFMIETTCDVMDTMCLQAFAKLRSRPCDSSKSSQFFYTMNGKIHSVEDDTLCLFKGVGENRIVLVSCSSIDSSNITYDENSSNLTWNGFSIGLTPGLPMFVPSPNFDPATTWDYWCQTFDLVYKDVEDSPTPQR